MKQYILRNIVGKEGNQYKQGVKYKHKYTDKQGNLLSKREYEPLIKHVYIAPAYDNVKINKNQRGKILAIGTDDKGRKQYTYNPDYIQKATDNKYRKLIEFGNNYKCIMNRINKDMISFNDSKKKQIAMILKMIDECNFRVGNEKYTKENKSFGVCTLENQHIKLGKDNVTIDFIGKEGVRNTCRVKNKRLIKNLRTRKKQLGKKDRIFSYRSNSKYYTISAADVNRYLKQFGDFSAKNFRTWTANTDLIKELKKHEKSSKQILSECIKKVAGKMHHTPAICKKNYINKELMDMYLNQNDRYRYYFRSSDKEGISEDLIKFLKDVYH
jgi:DNA topoisomerase I